MSILPRLWCSSGVTLLFISGKFLLRRNIHSFVGQESTNPLVVVDIVLKVSILGFILGFCLLTHGKS